MVTSEKEGLQASFYTDTTCGSLKIPLRLKDSTRCKGPPASGGGSRWSPVVARSGRECSRV